ncbi:hypothetical protein [Mechercharimyces sp. CAU 1602]|uniref:DUF4376 domain-containing protein n=1 Tax=Mechercharimyces sp. CAU 1602 TaxID=2973933 RepID=UPI0021616B7E|nr:hypothetical protein [Mechercharimyces sp. CAU 1602]MCS1350328.1 hypothetical protein [Mechercharimyces sp. CAU 1602]
MKIILFDGDEIKEVLKGCENVEVDDETNCIYFESGELCGIKSDYAIVDDDAVPEDAILESNLLEPEKVRKISSLNNRCESAILSGFTSETTEHTYQFNTTDQINMTQQYTLLLGNPDISTVDWKTEDSGVVAHSRDEFISIVNEAEEHKRGKIEKYWRLKSKVQASTTREEVRSISWDGGETVEES